MKLGELVRGWDFLAALAAASAVWWLLPDWPSNTFASALYGMGISVLSIVFAVFFTALAVLIAAGDDDFVSFLKELGIYSGIVATYRFTLMLLFIALMFSVLAFAWTAAIIDAKHVSQSKYVVVTFAFLFFYSLFGVIYSTYDALEYAKRRIEFVGFRKEKTPRDKHDAVSNSRTVHGFRASPAAMAGVQPLRPRCCQVKL